jgi:hypothetical protein
LSQGEKLGGQTSVYGYVNSQVPHPWGRKFPFFLTYCNYNGAHKAYQVGVSAPNFPNSTMPQNECKMGTAWGRELVGEGRWKEREVMGWWLWLKYFICIYENRIMKPIKFFLKGERRDKKKLKKWGQIGSKYIICMNGNITVKHPCTSHIY